MLKAFNRDEECFYALGNVWSTVNELGQPFKSGQNQTICCGNPYTLPLWDPNINWENLENFGDCLDIAFGFRDNDSRKPTIANQQRDQF